MNPKGDDCRVSFARRKIPPGRQPASRIAPSRAESLQGFAAARADEDPRGGDDEETRTMKIPGGFRGSMAQMLRPVTGLGAPYIIDLGPLLGPKTGCLISL